MIWLLASMALADDASDLLARVDTASSPTSDAHMVLDITSTDDRGRTSERTLELWQKGDDKRLATFTAPARVSGVALLVPDGETVYLYLPSYGRPRRVVGKSRGDAFFGTNFAMEDLSRISWAEEFTAVLAEPLHLTLTPTSESAASARVELYVRAEDDLPSKVEHYDSDGTLMRRIVFDDVRAVGDRPLAHSVVVSDVARSRTTRASVRQAEFDVGVPDDHFSLAHLSQ